MYAFTAAQQSAWQQVFERLSRAISPPADLEHRLRFNTDAASLLSDDLWIGQTCGYPLITGYRETLRPVAVPLFDAEGCEGVRYSSAIVVHTASPITALEQCEGTRVAINGPD